MIYLYVGVVFAFEFINLNVLNGALNSIACIIIISTVFILARLNSLKQKIDYIDDYPLTNLSNNVEKFRTELESIKDQINEQISDTKYDIMGDIDHIGEYVDWLEKRANKQTEDNGDLDHTREYVDWLEKKLKNQTKKE